jgi:hypothetical protein
MPYPPGYTVGGPLGEPKFGPAITKADAIRLAEQFVADNGFTTAIPNRPKLRFDIADFGSVDEVLARRHNTLRPTAYGYTREYRGQGKGWTIVFRHREGGDWGMAVTMYPDGTDIHAMHLGFSLRYCKRLPWKRAEQTDQPERAQPAWSIPFAAVARARLSSSFGAFPETVR